MAFTIEVRGQSLLLLKLAQGFVVSKPSPQLQDLRQALNDHVVPERAYDERIICADFHMHIPPDYIYRYVEDDRAREILEKRGTPPVNKRPTTANFGRRKKPTIDFDRIHGSAVTSEEIREICDELALDAAIVQPGTNLPFHRTSYPTIVNALTRAYNDFLIEEVVDADDEIYSAPFIPHWDVDFAVEELDRIGDEEGFVAAHNWMNSFKLWGDIEYDPIFEKLEELNLNLILHTTGDGPSVLRGSESIRSSSDWLVPAYAFGAMANAVNMVVSGVFDKFPDLKVSFQEAGTNWLPYVAYRLDESYLRGHVNETELLERFRDSPTAPSSEKKQLDRMPSEYLFDNIYVATQPITYPNIPRMDHVEGLLKACQAERTFMYTSDWPHVGLDPVNWVYETPCIDKDLRERILCKNTEEFCRLPGEDQ